MIDAGDVDKETGEAEVSIYAVDYDSYLVYYSYSLDGGESFSKLQKWEPRSADTLKFTLKVPSGIAPDLVVKVYNKYDYTTMSNHVYFPSVSYEEEEKGEGISKMEEMPEGSMDGEAVEAGVMTAKNPSPGETGTVQYDKRYRPVAKTLRSPQTFPHHHYLDLLSPLAVTFSVVVSSLTSCLP